MAETNNAQEAAAQNSVQNGKKGKSRRGFAAMSPERQREIASQGGRAAHQKGTAHQFTSEEAAKAGRIGGLRSRSGGNRAADGETNDRTSGAGEDSLSFNAAR